jgi:holo-[acyl-carrier protein] synthase
LAVEAPIVVGIDLVTIGSISESLAEFGDRFLERIFTEEEIRYCRSRERGAALESFAARFAAKEATIKALGIVDVGLDWRSIEVVRERNGACKLSLKGVAAEAARAARAGSLSLSLSHAGDYAIAVVVGRQELEERA